MLYNSGLAKMMMFAPLLLANYHQVTGKLNLCQTQYTPQISPFRFTLLASIPFQTGSIAG